MKRYSMMLMGWVLLVVVSSLAFAWPALMKTRKAGAAPPPAAVSRPAISSSVAAPPDSGGAVPEDPTLAATLAGWQELTPLSAPSPRSSVAMAYDTARGVAVLFGGSDDDIGEVNDTWEFDSATQTWTEKQPAHRPPVRFGHAMAYDAARGVTVLFGGVENAAEKNDTWLWDGQDWTQATPVTSPSPRWLAAMSYDPQRQVIVLFGGLTDGTEYGDTFEWDGTNWVEAAVTGPSPRQGAGLSYDTRRNVMVLFGGFADLNAYKQVWERTGSGDWVQVNTNPKPPGRERFGMTYLPQVRRSFVFGGLDLSIYYDDTFLWDGQRWRTRTFPVRPASRCCFAMTYDPVQGGVLLFGGSASWAKQNDTWLFR